MRNSRKRGTLPRAETQKRLNRFKLFRDGPNLSRFDACDALALSRVLDAASQGCTALLHQRLEFVAHFLGWTQSSLKLLLQAVHVVNARTYLRERCGIASGPPPFCDQIAGDDAHPK